MLHFNIDEFIKEVQEVEGDIKLEETEGMKYIDEIMKQKEVLKIKDIDFNKFTLEDMDRYRSLWNDISEVNKESNEIYKKTKKMEPRMIRKTNFI